MSTVIELLSERGIRLQRYTEGTHKGLCPQCSHMRKNKTELCLSVTIDADGAVWNCHNCTWADGVKLRYEPIQQKRPRPVVKPPAPQGNLTQGARSWLNSRGITDAVIERNKITSEQMWMPGCEKGESVSTIAFPYFRDGTTANVKYRSHDKRFCQVKDAAKIFYKLDDIVGADVVIITEGEIDALSLEVAGILNAISVPDGAPKQVKDETPDPEDDRKFEYVHTCSEALAGAKKIILAVDHDEPGQALGEELARRLGKERCWTVTWPTAGDVTCKDANEVLMQHGPEVLRECIAHAKPYPIKGLHKPSAFREDYLRAYQGQKAELLSTGWRSVDALFRVRRRLLHLVTGIPSSGKSQWLDALLMHLMEASGWKVAYCSFENDPGEDHLPKLAELRMRAPFWDGPTRRMSIQDADAALTWLEDRVTFIQTDDESPTIDYLLEKARAAVAREGIQALVIDPYNEIEHKRGRGQSETEYVSEMLGKVKRFARNNDVAVFFVAHPAKPERKDGKIPELSLYDISGSAHWVNKTDVGIIVNRDYTPGSRDVTIDVKKVRFKQVGMAGKAVLQFDRATGRYSETAPMIRSVAND